MSQKISIIVPIYNSENYLSKCLDSLVNQTFTNIEIICVNDGSTDNSLEILQNYAQKDNRIIIISQENQGQGVARNNAIKIASGEYIGFVDSDDWVDLTMFEKLYRTAKQFDSEIVHCDFYEVYKDNFYPNSTTKYLKRQNINIKPNIPYNFKNMMKHVFYGITNFPWAKLYKRSFIVDNDIEFVPIKYNEDNPFCLKGLILAKKIIYVDEHLYYYLYRENSSTRIINRQIEEMYDSLNSIRIHYFNSNADIENAFNEFWVNILLNDYLCYLPSVDKRKAVSEINQKLTPKQLEIFNKKAKKEKIKKILKFIFSIKNSKNKLYKEICFIGIKFRLKNRNIVIKNIKEEQ